MIKLVSVLLVFTVSTGSAAADDLGDLTAKVEALQAEIAALKGARVEKATLPVGRFDGRWEGKIIGDKKANDCRDGEIRATVRDGKVEGSRWFFSGFPAPIKGTILADGSYSGYQNRGGVVGTFDGDSAQLRYEKPDGCDSQIVLRKVGPL